MSLPGNPYAGLVAALSTGPAQVVPGARPASLRAAASAASAASAGAPAVLDPSWRGGAPAPLPALP